jgi:hypothetical protein
MLSRHSAQYKRARVLRLIVGTRTRVGFVFVIFFGLGAFLDWRPKLFLQTLLGGLVLGLVYSIHRIVKEWNVPPELRP